jgi:hypothetical protein
VWPPSVLSSRYRSASLLRHYYRAAENSTLLRTVKLSLKGKTHVCMYGLSVLGVAIEHEAESSLKTESCSAGQVISRQNPKARYRDHKNLPRNCIQSQLNPVFFL